MSGPRREIPVRPTTDANGTQKGSTMVIFLAFVLTLVVLGGAYYDLQQTEQALKSKATSSLS